MITRVVNNQIVAKSIARFNVLLLKGFHTKKYNVCVYHACPLQYQFCHPTTNKKKIVFAIIYINVRVKYAFNIFLNYFAG